jgi:hypothetical protein
MALRLPVWSGAVRLRRAILTHNRKERMRKVILTRRRVPSDEVAVMVGHVGPGQFASGHNEAGHDQTTTPGSRVVEVQNLLGHDAQQGVVQPTS